MDKWKRSYSFPSQITISDLKREIRTWLKQLCIVVFSRERSSPVPSIISLFPPINLSKK